MDDSISSIEFTKNKLNTKFTTNTTRRILKPNEKQDINYGILFFCYKTFLFHNSYPIQDERKQKEAVFSDSL
jgi:hypothetical protein